MALNLPLYDGWRLRSDKYNVILSHFECGREISHGFFSTIEAALQSFLEMKIRRFNSASIFALLQAINSMQHSLNKALQPLNLQVVPISMSSKIEVQDEKK